MLFKLICTYAFLALLTGAAYDECDGQDMLWSDIADNSTIDAAFSTVCSSLTNDNNGNSTADGCINVGENHIDAKVDLHLTEPEEHVSSTAMICEEALGYIRQGCEKGGRLEVPFMDGEAGVEFSAYPRAHNC